MAPSAAVISQTLKSVVTDAFHDSTDRDVLSVTFARNRAEKTLRLKPGYLSDGAWKVKSKELIKTLINDLLEREDADAAPPVKEESPHLTVKHTNRSPNESEPPAPKRRKTTKMERRSSSANEGQSAEDESAEEQKPRRPVKSEKLESDDEEDVKPARRQRVPDSDSNASDTNGKPSPRDTKMEDEREEEEPNPAHKPSTKVEQRSAASEDVKVDATAKYEDADPSDSELSSLIDEAPKVKRSKKTKPDKKTRREPASKTEGSPAEAEVKKLQGQLVRCGIRKIWAFELKSYGGDSQGKIRHLKRMLRDAGMEGRFSEARAREIKEARELAADLEAVQEGELSWGAGRSSRSRKPAPVVKEDSESEEKVEEMSEVDEWGGSDGDKSRDVKPRIKDESRRVKAKQELAFLGDEEESD